ncbi:MAG: hypothetical protein WAO20_20840 [Acidobacteriota bacterium]
MYGPFMVRRKLLRKYIRFIPLFGPLTLVSLAWTFWFVPGFPINVESILLAGITGIFSSYVSLKFWQGRHRVNEPVLVADQGGLRLFPALWGESVHLKWEEIEKIYPYRSLGNDYLGIATKIGGRTAHSRWSRWLSEIQKWMENPPTYAISLFDLDRSAEEIAAGLSPYFRLGPKQSRKPKNLSAIGIGMSFLFPLYLIADHWSVLEPIRGVLALSLFALAFLFLSILLRPAV